MNLLHTWAGVLLGSVLFGIFWMGSLSVFAHEIDRWMAPATRLPQPASTLLLEPLRRFHDAAVAAKSPIWVAVMPTDRIPVFRISWFEPSGLVTRMADPVSGNMLPDPGTRAGTRFIYPFHYMLNIRFAALGYWIVGLAAMMMLALCVSGVIVHRKIFADFFTFRADRLPRRLILDLHNVTGVVGLPFHFLITLSGMIIFWSVYFPSSLMMAYQNGHQGFSREAFGSFDRPKANEAATPISFDDLAERARHLWRGNGELGYLFVVHPGDAAAFMRIGRINDAAIDGAGAEAVFDMSNGELLHQSTEVRPIMSVQRFISGLHLIRIRHWSIRWAYLGLGLTGCAMIATGYLFWIESRRRQHIKLGLRGVRIVEGATIGSVTGILVATLAFLTVNRLLPLGASFVGQDRAALEIWTFYLVWLATFAHGWLRLGLAWREQCATIALLAVVAVVLNWITTGDHLIQSLGHRHLWPIAGIDLLLLTGAATATVAVARLRRLDA